MLKNYNLEYYPEEKILNPPSHAKDEINQILDSLAKDRNKKIVDFGSGGGRLTIPLLKNGFEVTAIDLDEKSRKQLLKTAVKIGKNKKLHIKKVFPKNEKYDYILGTDILHHVDMNKYLKLFNNHLKKGGKIIFSEPNSWNLSWWIFVFLFLDWKQEKGIVQTNYFNLIKQSKSANLKKINITGLFLFPPMLFNKINWLRRLTNVKTIGLSLYHSCSELIIFPKQKIKQKLC